MSNGEALLCYPQSYLPWSALIGHDEERNNNKTNALI